MLYLAVFIFVTINVRNETSWRARFQFASDVIYFSVETKYLQLPEPQSDGIVYQRFRIKRNNWKSASDGLDAPFFA